MMSTQLNSGWWTAHLTICHNGTATVEVRGDIRTPDELDRCIAILNMFTHHLPASAAEETPEPSNEGIRDEPERQASFGGASPGRAAVR